jgi:hypothetical protein
MATTDNVARDASFWSLLRQFEGTPLASQLPSPSAFIDVTDSDLIAFGNGLVAHRQEVIRRLQQPATAVPVASNAESPPAVGAKTVGSALFYLNMASVAVKGHATNSAVSPVGMLNLERLEMTPAGVERGGLLATIPLAPKEQTFVAQKEWSVTSQEFTTIVTDSLDNYSETGVTENTQLAQSATSQVAHNNQFNVTASASGGIGFVSGSASTTFGSQDQNSTSATNSRNNSIQTTRLASARVKQSHKTTISTTTVAGTSEATTRKLENPSATDPMRIDYFSLMCKWYVALYRYGLRLTYDITVPEPGATLRKVYGQLADLQAQASQTFQFTLQYSDITIDNYQQLASQYAAQVPFPPTGPIMIDTAGNGVPTTIKEVGGQPVTGINPSQGGWFTYWPLQFSVDEGYEIDKVELSAHIGDNDSTGNKPYSFSIVGCDTNLNEPKYGQQTIINKWTLDGFLKGFTGSVTITSVFEWANPALVTFYVYTIPTSAFMEQWQSSVWNALYNAAQSQFYAQQQSITAQISLLQSQINNVDTLTLRREENDEIMKCVLSWLKPNFTFMPPKVVADYIINALVNDPMNVGSDLAHGINFTGDAGISGSPFAALSGNEDVINFINQAIEWENVVFFLYSYFWDEPFSWDFIRQIQHNDKTQHSCAREAPGSC